jgi:hypothetical protein
MDFYAAGVGWVPGDPSVAIGSHRAEAGFGREHLDMLITHFDVIRLSGKYQWLQGIATLQALNMGAGSGQITLDHSMRVEILPLENSLAASAVQAVKPEQGGPVPKRSRNRGQ